MTINHRVFSQIKKKGTPGIGDYANQAGLLIDQG